MERLAWDVPVFQKSHFFLPMCYHQALLLVLQDRYFRSCRTEIWVKFHFSRTKNLMVLDWSHLTGFESRMDHVSKMVGYFSNGTGNFCSPTRTNMQTYISGFVASVPLHKGTEKTVLTVQKTSLLIFPSALLYPTTPERLFILDLHHRLLDWCNGWLGPRTDSGVHHLNLPSHCCPSLSTAAPRRHLWFWSSCSLLQETAMGLIQIAPH